MLCHPTSFCRDLPGSGSMGSNGTGDEVSYGF